MLKLNGLLKTSTYLMYHVHCTCLVLPVVQLGVLNEAVTEPEEVVHGLVSLVCQVRHLEGRLHFEGNSQEVEYLREKVTL